jgi:hypothetical protein
MVHINQIKSVLTNMYTQSPAVGGHYAFFVLNIVLQGGKKGKGKDEKRSKQKVMRVSNGGRKMGEVTFLSLQSRKQKQ